MPCAPLWRRIPPTLPQCSCTTYQLFKFLITVRGALDISAAGTATGYELSSDFFTGGRGISGAAQEKEENGGAVRQSKSEEADAVQSESGPAARSTPQGRRAQRDRAGVRAGLLPGKDFRHCTANLKTCKNII